MNNELTKNELAKNKLTKEDISNLFQSLQYGENYDDPYTLWDLSSCLLEHYLCCGRLDYIIFSYQLKAYAALEMSRTGDKAAGKASVDLYKTILSYKDKLHLICDDYKTV